MTNHACITTTVMNYILQEHPLLTSARDGLLCEMEFAKGIISIPIDTYRCIPNRRPFGRHLWALLRFHFIHTSSGPYNGQSYIRYLSR